MLNFVTCCVEIFMKKEVLKLSKVNDGQSGINPNIRKWTLVLLNLTLNSIIQRVQEYQYFSIRWAVGSILIIQYVHNGGNTSTCALERFGIMLKIIEGRSWSYVVVGFTTTYAIAAYHHWCCGFDSRSGRGVLHYVIKFVSDLKEVGCFLRVLQKLTAAI